MPQFPDWVPLDAIDWYQRLCAGDAPHRTPLVFEESDIQALYRCLVSPKMEKAWKAVARRKSIAKPSDFAFHTIVVAYSCRINVREFSYPTTKEISEYQRIFDKLQTLCAEVDAAFLDWREDHLKHYFGGPPGASLQKLSDDLAETIKHKKRIRKDLKKLSGKPLSESGERTFVIRSLSERMKLLYDTPLHKVVASTAGTILEEDIDEETVRKLVS